MGGLVGISERERERFVQELELIGREKDRDCDMRAVDREYKWEQELERLKEL